MKLIGGYTKITKVKSQIATIDNQFTMKLGKKLQKIRQQISTYML